MEEIKWSGNEGESFEGDTIEDLLPQIKKSLAKKDIKHVIVKMIPGRKHLRTIEKKKTFADYLKEGNE